MGKSCKTMLFAAAVCLFPAFIAAEDTDFHQSGSSRAFLRTYRIFVRIAPTMPTKHRYSPPSMKVFLSDPYSMDPSPRWPKPGRFLPMVSSGCLRSAIPRCFQTVRQLPRRQSAIPGSTFWIPAFPRRTRPCSTVSAGRTRTGPANYPIVTKSV